MCIWKEYGSEDGVGAPWWDYVNEFMYRCNTEQFFSSKQCINDAMTHAKVENARVEQCMSDSGGLEGDVANSLLEEQLQAKDKRGVVILPAMYVNRVSIRGSLEFPVVFKAICAGFASGTVPTVCEKCSICGDQKTCITQGFCGSNELQQGAVSQINLGIAMAGLVVFFGIFSYIQHRRYQNQMQAQVKGIIAEYMPLESDQMQKGGNMVSEEDGEFT